MHEVVGGWLILYSRLAPCMVTERAAECSKERGSDEKGTNILTVEYAERTGGKITSLNSLASTRLGCPWLVCRRRIDTNCGVKLPNATELHDDNQCSPKQ